MAAQPLFYYQGTGAIDRVLYGLKEAKYIEGKPHFDYTERVSKRSNNASIPVGFFKDNKYSHISAVIFNPIATFGKVRALQSKKSSKIHFETYKYNDYGEKGYTESLTHRRYRESLLDGTSVFLNPYAVNPLPIELFEDRDLHIKENEMKVKIKPGFLFRRTVTEKIKVSDFALGKMNED